MYHLCHISTYLFQHEHGWLQMSATLTLFTTKHILLPLSGPVCCKISLYTVFVDSFLLLLFQHPMIFNFIHINGLWQKKSQKSPAPHYTSPSKLTTTIVDDVHLLIHPFVRAPIPTKAWEDHFCGNLGVSCRTSFSTKFLHRKFCTGDFVACLTSYR